MRFNTPGMIRLSRPLKKVKKEVRPVTVEPETLKTSGRSFNWPLFVLASLVLISIFILFKYGGIN